MRLAAAALRSAHGGVEQPLDLAACDTCNLVLLVGCRLQRRSDRRLSTPRDLADSPDLPVAPDQGRRAATCPKRRAERGDVVRAVTSGSILVSASWPLVRAGVRRVRDACRLRVAVRRVTLADVSTLQHPPA